MHRLGSPILWQVLAPVYRLTSIGMCKDQLEHLGRCRKLHHNVNGRHQERRERPEGRPEGQAPRDLRYPSRHPGPRSRTSLVRQLLPTLDVKRVKAELLDAVAPGAQVLRYLPPMHADEVRTF